MSGANYETSMRVDSLPGAGPTSRYRDERKNAT